MIYLIYFVLLFILSLEIKRSYCATSCDGTSFVKRAVAVLPYLLRNKFLYRVYDRKNFVYVLLRRYATARNVVQDNRKGSTIEGENNGLLRYVDRV